MKTKITLFLPHILIALFAIANLIRVFWDISITIGNWTFPAWTGAFAFVFLGLIVAWSSRAFFALGLSPIDE